jgi:hypothetical protein
LKCGMLLHVFQRGSFKTLMKNPIYICSGFDYKIGPYTQLITYSNPQPPPHNRPSLAF